LEHHQVIFTFLKSAYNFQFFDTQYNLFQEKKISLLRRAIFQMFGHKTANKEETAQNKEKYLF
jgi:hypothetical protein